MNSIYFNDFIKEKYLTKNENIFIFNYKKMLNV